MTQPKPTSYILVDKQGAIAGLVLLHIAWIECNIMQLTYSTVYVHLKPSINPALFSEYYKIINAWSIKIVIVSDMSLWHWIFKLL